MTDSTNTHTDAPAVATPGHLPRHGRRTHAASRKVCYDALQYPHPRAQQQRLERAVLEQLNRHRLLRAVDLAAAVAPERAFDAAMSAVQRQIARLVQQRLVQRSVVAHQTVYALTQRGAHRLEALRGDGPGTPPAPWCVWPAVHASARRVADRSNPEHTLLISQVVIAAEARGLTAWTESELRTLLKTAPLVVDVQRTRRGLWPDALLLMPSGSGLQLWWVEIDRSRRGSQRLADLAALVRAAGSTVRVPTADGGERLLPLRRITVLTSSLSIARADIGHLQQHVTVGLTGKSAVVQRDEGLFDVHVDVEQRLADGRVQVVTQTGARLVVRPWTQPGPGAWFDSGALPWRVTNGAWPPAQALRFAADIV